MKLAVFGANAVIHGLGIGGKGDGRPAHGSDCVGEGAGDGTGSPPMRKSGPGSETNRVPFDEIGVDVEA